MKYSKTTFLAYTFCLIKIVATVFLFKLFDLVGLYAFSFSINIISFCALFVAFIEENVKVYFFTMIMIILFAFFLWIETIVISLIGIKLKAFRKSSAVLVFIVALIEYAASFVFTYRETETFVGLVSVVVNFLFLAVATISLLQSVRKPKIKEQPNEAIAQGINC